ncbi:hypothetical protein RCH16_003088 [Cryobacterium sp. MP_M5]|uniref:cyclophilin-like fold protein n=1 Tax=unclassified Cryobacterium TaxID=2649013 RepID=UPI0018CA2339|nr:MULTISPECIES: cyclophilin-like fold protein [unclassified Cryobacterium]MBG6059687.1 hypothetical protein [Cryobacterium sp. MP_M3]MEC5178059.1 hypothetical protein [Cryobacterium sp. MP_M5]
MKNPVSLKKTVRTVVALSTVAIALALAGCGGSHAGRPATSSRPPITPSSEPPVTSAPAPKSTGTPIVMDIGGQEIAGELDTSATSLSLLAQLPLTLSFRDFGGQEKVAELPAPLDLTGAPAGSDASPTTIGYYAPDQRLVLYYDHVGYFAGIVPIGTYEDTRAIETQSINFTVTLREAD